MKGPTPMRPLVSIVIPTFNSAGTVGGTITSALTQAYDAVEVIVVDDGSTDDSARVVEAYGDRVTLIRTENSGVSAARNIGASMASGDLLFFCDSDDIMLPSCMPAAVAAWEAGTADTCVSVNSYFMRSDGISPLRVAMTPWFPSHRSERLARLQGNDLVAHMMCPRTVFSRLGGFDETLRSLEDWDLWIRITLAGHPIAKVLTPHVLYRWDQGSLSADHQRMLADERRMLEGLLAREGELGLKDEERAYICKRLDMGSPRELRFLADDAVDAGDFARAGELYRRAARLSPGDLKLQARRWTVGVLPALGRVWRRRQDGADRRY